jgi:hypothetical protein
VAAQKHSEGRMRPADRELKTPGLNNAGTLVQFEAKTQHFASFDVVKVVLLIQSSQIIAFQLTQHKFCTNHTEIQMSTHIISIVLKDMAHRAYINQLFTTE